MHHTIKNKTFRIRLSIVWFLLPAIGITIISACKKDKKEESDDASNSAIIAPTIDTFNLYHYKDHINVNNLEIDFISEKNDELKELDINLSGTTSNDTHRIKIVYDGILSKAIQRDLNNDGQNEFYIINVGEGSGSYGSIFAYQPSGSGFDTIRLQELNDEINEKYLGHDEFVVESQSVIRTFPLYNEIDPNCCPTGGRYRIIYKLVHKNNRLWLVPSSENPI